MFFKLLKRKTNITDIEDPIFKNKDKPSVRLPF